jgi:hypothetical protein
MKNQTSVIIKERHFIESIEKTALFLLKMSIIMSPMIIFLSLPFFRIGVWSKLEPVICGLYGVASCTSLSILLLCLIKPSYLLSCLHPVVILPALIGIWSLLCAPFSEVPLLSFFGDPRFGQGAVRYLSIASLCAGALICSKFRYFQRQTALLCAAVTVLVLGLNFVAGYYPQWQTYKFVDYLAFFGIYITAILFAAFPKASFSTKFIFVFAGMFVIFYSKNKSGIVLCSFLGVIVYCISYIFRSDIKKNRKFGIFITIFIPILILLSIVTFNGKTIQNGKLQHLINKNFYSLYSRSLLWDIAFKTTWENPTIFIHGLGWGHYSNQLIRFAGEENVSLHKDSKWDALNRGDWHSHNDFIETFLSCGFLGLLLWWSMLCALPLFCKKELIKVALILAAVLSGIFSLWFQFPAGIPFMAICFAFISQPLSEYDMIKNINIRKIKYVGCCVIGVFFVAEFYAFSNSLILGLQLNKIQNNFISSHNPFYETKKIAIREIVDSAGPGGIHFAILYRNIIANKLKAGINLNSSSTLDIFTQAYNKINNSPLQKCLIFYMSGIVVCNDLALALNVWENSDATSYPHLEIWEERVMVFLEKAYLRTDMAVPYLLWRLSKKDDAGILKVAEFILRKNSNDPVGLWFYGLALSELEENKQDETMHYLQKSLKNGIELIMPIDPYIKQKILEYKIQKI